ncbi:ABC transporter ATP-binding protein [Microbacterium saccharophilum]|uniref:ABC transporter ATP-binding protein n=1 Tax=Microbacterium saccharophilum TaxID=1213358 RepID=A0A5C8I793_9MICO|nr:ABC transporter ATP-binding protein [Microbacterium saccharophilum]TXK14189.1 ABC transporter ATP-binding protein [Microbacterium saccharophilum]GEP46748.1 putative oligopeptide ABC transporter, ATP-binding protein [Microbacterium saccharophilum]
MSTVDITDELAHTTEKDAPIIEVSGLAVDFWVNGEWVNAVRDMDYVVHPGEVLAIVGESGSGKSVSSMSLLGLLPPNSRSRGSVKLNGREILNAPTENLRKVRGNKIAVIFQEPMTALNPVYRIGFQIVESIRVHSHMPPHQAKERALELLRLVEMPDPQKAFDSFPHQLSGGQRQRAMIAQAISCDPDLLIADEPTTALDVTIQAEILELLRNLHKRLNSAIVIITHDLGVVADLADNVIVMRTGDVVERGTVHKIFDEPEHPYTQELLAAVPRLGYTSEGKTVRAGAPVLELRDAVIEYPGRRRVPAFRAVDQVSFSIHPGEIVGLVGESGSGKTTVARGAIGLLPFKEGSAKVEGVEMVGIKPGDLRELRKNIGIVFQDPGSSLNPRWPVGESIGEPLKLLGDFTDKEIGVRVEELLDQVELPRSFRNRYPHELSGGQRQRIGIARALALKPNLLIADEPTSALDVSVQARVLDLLEEIQAELGFACLFVSHDLAVVDRLADRIVVMNHGKLVEEGTPDQILRNPQQAYTKRLIAAIPVPDPTEQAVRREERRRVLDELKASGVQVDDDETPSRPVAGGVSGEPGLPPELPHA